MKEKCGGDIYWINALIKNKSVAEQLRLHLDNYRAMKTIQLNLPQVQIDTDIEANFHARLQDLRIEGEVSIVKRGRQYMDRMKNYYTKLKTGEISEFLNINSNHIAEDDAEDHLSSGDHLSEEEEEELEEDNEEEQDRDDEATATNLN